MTYFTLYDFDVIVNSVKDNIYEEIECKTKCDILCTVSKMLLKRFINDFTKNLCNKKFDAREIEYKNWKEELTKDIDFCCQCEAVDMVLLSIILMSRSYISLENFHCKILSYSFEGNDTFVIVLGPIIRNLRTEM